jgi:hypothetical protein
VSEGGCPHLSAHKPAAHSAQPVGDAASSAAAWTAEHATAIGAAVLQGCPVWPCRQEPADLDTGLLSPEEWL